MEEKVKKSKGEVATFSKSTEQLIEICEEILMDIPKVVKGNKSAAQRIRTKTIKLTKISKDWRKLSLDQEKKDLKKKRSVKAKSRRRKS